MSEQTPTQSEIKVQCRVAVMGLTRSADLYRESHTIASEDIPLFAIQIFPWLRYRSAELLHVSEILQACLEERGWTITEEKDEGNSKIAPPILAGLSLYVASSGVVTGR